MINEEDIQNTISLANAYLMDLGEDLLYNQKNGCICSEKTDCIYNIMELIYSLEGSTSRNIVTSSTATIFNCLQTAIANFSGVSTIDPNAIVNGVTIIVGNGDNRPDPLLIEWSDLVSTGSDGRVRYDNTLWSGWVPFLEVDNSPWLTEGVDFTNLTTGGFILTNPIYDGQVIRAVNYAKSGVTPPLITPTVNFTQPLPMTVGDADQTLVASTTNPNVSIVFTSLTPSVATIVSGKLHAVSAGNVVIRATSPSSSGYNEVHVDRTVVMIASIPSNARIILIAGQSNAQGLAPIKDLYTSLYSATTNPSFTQEFPNVKIWNVASQQFENLQVGVNEGGLNGDDLAAHGSPGYDDGFAWEIGFSRRFFLQRPSEEIYIIKAGGWPITSTDGASIATWQSTLFNLYKEQITNAKQWLSIRNKTAITDFMLWDQFESDIGNSNYQSDLTALMNRFVSENLMRSDTFKIIVGADSGNLANASIRSAQHAFVDSNAPYAQYLNTSGFTYLGDGIHIDTKSMTRGGDSLFYNIVYNTTGNSFTYSPLVNDDLYSNFDPYIVRYDNEPIYTLAGLNGVSWNHTAKGKDQLFLYGGVGQRYAGGLSGAVGLMSTNVVADITSMQFAFFLNANKITWFRNGYGEEISASSVSIGDLVRMYIGDTSVKIQQSTNNGATWVDVYDFGLKNSTNYHCFDLNETFRCKISNPFIF